MKETLFRIFYYIGLPIIITALLIAIFYWKLNNFKKSLSFASTIVQTLAIFIGGLWAYHKFAWDKKAESAIKVKALLMEYSQSHNYAAMQYRINVSNISKEDAYKKYVLSLLSVRNKIVDQIHLSCYLPAKLRQKIFDTFWLTVGNAHGESQEHLDVNWKKFSEEMEEIKEELDKIVSI